MGARATSDQDVREYIYIDTDRVRSLLAQMSEDGLPTDIEKSKTRSGRLGASVKVLSADFGGDLAESRTSALGDLYVSMLEEVAVRSGYLAEPPTEILQTKLWLRGKVRAKIKPGLLFRISAPTTVLNAQHLIRLTKQAMVHWNVKQQETGEAGMRLLELLYGDDLAVSIRPAEQGEDARAAFVGTIPADHDFAPLKNELILQRYGVQPSQMTTLLQVARVSTERDRSTARLDDIGGRLRRAADSGGGAAIDREAIDSFIAQIGEQFERNGLSPVPRWPAIAVIPLAIYRSVSLSPGEWE